LEPQTVNIVCQAVITIVLGLGTMYFAWKGKQNSQAAVELGQHNSLVGASNAGKIDEAAKVAKDTHTLVNSNMGVQLQLNASVTKRLADVTKDPIDKEAALSAARLYADHLGKQAIVDSRQSADKDPQTKPPAKPYI